MKKKMIKVGLSIALAMAATISMSVLTQKETMAEDLQEYQDMEELPIYSLDYLNAYISSHEIELPKVEKKEVMEKAMASGSELLYLKEVNDEGRYAVTNEQTEFMYTGETKDNKPDGIGRIIKLLSATEYETEDGIKVEFGSCFDAPDSSQIYAVFVYMGEFKDGYYDGYGWKYMTPFTSESDMLNSLYYRSLGADYVAVSSDTQENIIATCNPVKYMGDFKKGKYNGDGVQISYPLMQVPVGQEEGISSYMEGDVEREIVIFQGEYKKGKADGKMKEYLYGKLNFEGEMKNGKRSGNGVSYYKNTEQKHYEGEWRADVYDGEGTLYDESGEVIYSGEWDFGDYAY